MVKMLLTLFFVLLFIVLHCGCLTIPPIPIVGVWVPRASRGWLLRILFVYWRSQGFIWPFLFPFVFQIISFLFSLAFWKITFNKLFRSFCHVWHITIGFHGFRCHNLNIRFMTQCGVQRPMSQKNVFVCETNSHKWEKVQEMEPNDFQVHSHFGSCICVGVPNV
jgi:hypothetical protein